MSAGETMFPHLFSPVRIGPITVPNRVYFGPHGKSYAVDGKPSDRHINYWVERAKGGIGLIITEVENIHPTGLGGRPPGAHILNVDDTIIPAYQRVTQAVHRHGAKIFCQLAHEGVSSSNPAFTGIMPLWGPSSVRADDSPIAEMPKEMELEDIQALVRAFRDAAVRAIKGGFDGVEVHCTFFGLLHHFASPTFNKRTDQYGGSLENRMRLLFEVVEAVRGAVGRNVVVGVRLNGQEVRQGGMGLDEAKIIAQNLEASGLVDYINTAIGGHVNIYMNIPPMFVPRGYALFMAQGIKEVVKRIPVFGIGRFTSPEQIEQALASNSADLIGLVRALIADPEFVNKAREGRLNAIRPCIGVNTCIGREYAGYGVGCVHNPATGREGEWGIGTLKPATVKKRLLVVGGGPAGLEAALTAALRGHQVDLYEREAALGGQLNLAVRQPYRQDLGAIAGWRVDHLGQAGVRVHLNTEVTAELVLAQDPDAVVVATGSAPDASGFSPARYDVPRLPGVDQPNVFTAWEVLRGRYVSGKTGLGQRVVVLDDNNHHEAAGTVEYLLDQGKHVEVVTRFNTIGAALWHTLEETPTMQRLKKKGVVLHPRQWARAVQGNSVRVYDMDTEEERILEDVDSVVLVARKLPEDRLYFALKGKVKELHRIGDCLAPRLIDNAIYEGHALARAL
ncbi:MAG: FAD-dependent oxidoreductase [Chloroflexi bacterium]|nr:FAD-dependent oxidoreductase [Chloroflexota bacterium]